MMNDKEIDREVQQARLRFGIVGTSPGLTAAVERAIRVAPIDLSVLITGESGTGKEFFPKIIHAFGARKHAKYIAVNCGAIPEGTIESELFGHEKGSFTGAVGTRKGYFEEADGGTIFLDEVAELPLTTQARLLRVLESGEFMKVGSSQVQKANVRVVAATNVDMQRAVAEGRFREDLYYRLSTVQISIPPLRERGDDIVLLARKFARDFAERYRMPVVQFDPEATEALLRYRWPGNVRQLKNVVEQLSLFENGHIITADRVMAYLPKGAAVTAPTLLRDAPQGASSAYDREREMLFNMIFRLQERIEKLTERLDNQQHISPIAPHPSTHQPAAIEHVEPYEDITATAPAQAAQLLPTIPVVASLSEQERASIISTLERNGGRRKAAAAELGISERTLYRKIKEYGLDA